MDKRNLISIVFVLFLLIAGAQVFAHTINYELEAAPAGEVAWYYLKLGFRHILPDGFDHILFVTGLCLLTDRVKSILWQATAFTIAHSITLLLSMKNIILAPAEVIEPIIALSILFIAIENIILSELKPWRILMVFLFGLIHGLGFASSLNEIGLPRDKFLTSIVSFNVGVELGQVAIILALYFLLLRPFGKKDYFKPKIVLPVSLCIAAIAIYWTIERVFFA